MPVEFVICDLTRWRAIDIRPAERAVRVRDGAGADDHVDEQTGAGFHDEVLAAALIAPVDPHFRDVPGIVKTLSPTPLCVNSCDGSSADAQRTVRRECDRRVTPTNPDDGDRHGEAA
jgi:hypothetical protein